MKKIITKPNKEESDIVTMALYMTLHRLISSHIFKTNRQARI